MSSKRANRAPTTSGRDPDAANDGAGGRAKRVRMSPHEREEQIVAGAIAFFSEVGFGGQTRELARRLGITQGLLYRYFPDKQSLLERVYSTIFEGRWSPRWEDELQERDVPLHDRLVRFYTEYGRVIHTSDWVRTYLLAGLDGLEINKRYRALLRRRIFPIVINEIRHELGLPANPAGVLSADEDELMMTLHGMIFYEGIRKWVYRIDVPADPQLKLARQIAMVLHGARLIYGQAPLAPTQATRRT